MTSARVHYRERQILTVADLRDEQRHRIDRWRRHLLKHHGWGIISGLHAVLKPDGSITICPGVAIDGYGRMLRIGEPKEIDPETVQKAVKCLETIPETETGCLCLRHVLLLDRSQCDPSRTEGRRPYPDRWLESHVIVLARGLDPCDARKAPRLTILDDRLEPLPQGARFEERCGPRLVPICCLPPAPSDRKSDQICVSDLVQAEKSAGTARLYPACMPWATLTAEYVTAPSGNATLVVGTDPTDPWRRFGVAVRDADGAIADYRFEVDRNRRTTIKGPVVIDGLLEIHRPRAVPSRAPLPPPVPPTSVIEFGPVPDLAEGESPLPRPWQIYRVARQRDGSKPSALRIEIENPGKENGFENYRFSIGTWVEPRDKAESPEAVEFRSILSAAADGVVRISDTHSLPDAPPPAEPHRLLIVEDGVIREGPIQAILADPRFAEAVLNLSTAGSLDLDFTEEPTYSQADGRVTYKIQVSNRGSVDVFGIQLHQSAFDPDEPSPSGDEIDPDPQLQFKISEITALKAVSESGFVDSAEVTGTFVPLVENQTLVVAVLAYGVGPVGSIVYAIKGKEVAWS